MDYSSLWYLIIGFGLVNGMPHFAFGAAGKVFRTPLGKESSPAMNVGWGLFNFVAASALVWWRLAAGTPDKSDIVLLLAGFWFGVLMFGVSIRRFISD